MRNAGWLEGEFSTQGLHCRSRVLSTASQRSALGFTELSKCELSVTSGEAIRISGRSTGSNLPLKRRTALLPKTL